MAADKDNFSCTIDTQLYINIFHISIGIFNGQFLKLFSLIAGDGSHIFLYVDFIVIQVNFVGNLVIL